MRASSQSELFVTSFGSGRPVLCLHGIEAHGLRFVGIAGLLTDMRIVAPDLRGHGRSPKHGPWTVEQHVRDLLPILVTLGPATVVLGHSYGALIAWELARAAPHAMHGLVLVDPAIAVSTDLAREGQENAASNRVWPDMGAALDEMLSGTPPEARWAAALDVAVACRSDADGSVRPIVDAAAIHEGWEQMREPLRPTSYGGTVLLLEAGWESGLYLSAAVAAQMREQLGERLEHVVLDAPHSIPSHRPDLLADHVRAFTTRRPVATRS